MKCWGTFISVNHHGGQGSLDVSQNPCREACKCLYVVVVTKKGPMSYVTSIPKIEYSSGLQQNFTTSANCTFVVSTTLTSGLTCKEWRNFPFESLHFSSQFCQTILCMLVSQFRSLVFHLPDPSWKFGKGCTVYNATILPHIIRHRWMKVPVGFWLCQKCIVWCW